MFTTCVKSFTFFGAFFSWHPSFFHPLLTFFVIDLDSTFENIRTDGLVMSHSQYGHAMLYAHTISVWDRYSQVLFSIPLTAVAAEGLKELWQCFDKNGDGSISHDDFATEGELRIWSELKENFDKDGDGAVSGDE